VLNQTIAAQSMRFVQMAEEMFDRAIESDVRSNPKKNLSSLVFLLAAFG
jgi:hypothetical protein